MINLFRQYVSKGNISEALLVGHNLLNKNRDNKDIFDLYFDFLLCLASDKEAENGGKYIQQAEAALTFFSENADMSEDVVHYIQTKEEDLIQVYSVIEEERKEKEIELLRAKIKANDDTLSSIKKFAGKLLEAGKKEELDNILEQIGKMDTEIEKEYLVERQQKEYQILTRQCSDSVSVKLKAFERKENVEYNLRAIEAYEKVFKYFKGNEVISEHKEVVKNLFAFDAARLFNETLVYYNHVYSYILSKLNDEEKFKLTKLAIVSEKKR